MKFEVEVLKMEDAPVQPKMPMNMPQHGNPQGNPQQNPQGQQGQQQQPH